MKVYNHLTQGQRYQIWALMKTNINKTEIAKKVDVDKSTIYREIKRNSGFRGYRPIQAQQKAILRKKLKVKSYKLSSKMILFIRLKLKENWSPEQISGYLKSRNQLSISHEWIYQYIRNDLFAGGNLHKCLRQANKKRRKRYGSLNRRGQIKNRISIDERPQMVEEKIRIGDWEIDTMIGKDRKGVLVTIVDRMSKLTFIKNVSNKSAKVVTESIISLLKPLKNWVHTITVDNGKEFAWHEKFSASLNAKVYFAHPYQSWERGLNENTNGLIRQYFPKKTNFKAITNKEISYVNDKLNNRPRKTLGFYTPNEIFYSKQKEVVI